MRTSVNFNKEKVAHALYAMLKPKPSETVKMALIGRIEKGTNIYGAICKSIIETLLLITSDTQ